VSRRNRRCSGRRCAPPLDAYLVSKTMRTLLCPGGPAIIVAAHLFLGAGCASGPPTVRSEGSQPVEELKVPFAVHPPLTAEDAPRIADVVRDMLGPGEDIVAVDPVPCTARSCEEGIESRAEAFVHLKNSCSGDSIYLCKRSGRWIASRPTIERWRDSDCPDPAAPVQLANPPLQPDGASRRR
jgi:hypothetical protein